jgi:hypothetical protein
VIGVNRIVDGEARTLYLHVDPFGAVRDLFERSSPHRTGF